MRFRLVLALALLAIVVVGAVVYWLAWQRRPDYFIVQQELNLYPFGSLEALLWSDTEASVPAQVVGLTDGAERASEIVAAAAALRAQEAQLTADSERLKREMAAASQLIEKHRATRIEEFRRGELERLETERTAILGQLSVLESRVNPDEREYDPLRVTVAHMRVRLAEHDVQLAIKRADVADNIVKRFGQFARPDDMRQWRELDERASTIRDTLISLNTRRIELRQLASNLITELRSQRVSRVGLVDFLYFSIGVSTTTTFGDIIPNHTFTRAIVTAQLVASILIVGLFVNSLSSTFESRRRVSSGERQDTPDDSSVDRGQ